MSFFLSSFSYLANLLKIQEFLEMLLFAKLEALFF